MSGLWFHSQRGPSAGYFRTSGVELAGIAKACWTVELDNSPRNECTDGPLRLEVTPGSSFGFKSARGYSTGIDAAHVLATFVAYMRWTVHPIAPRAAARAV